MKTIIGEEITANKAIDSTVDAKTEAAKTNCVEGGKKCDPYAIDKIGLAGIIGETDAFYAALASLKRLYLEVFNNKIIPHGRAGGGLECDLICAGRRKIYIFEVKRLSGSLSVCPDGSWLLKPLGGRGEKKLGDGFAQAARCRRALAAFLSGRLGAGEDGIASAIECRVLFAGDNFDVSSLSAYKDSFIALNNLESYLYLSELTGPRPAFIGQAVSFIAGLKGMCVVSVNDKDGEPVSILRGDMTGPIFYREIYIKDGAIDYYKTFCRAETILSTDGVSHITLKGKTRSGEVLASVNYYSGGNPLSVLISSPFLEFKPRGFGDVRINFRSIAQIAFC